jgi:hypothetical protein
LTAAERTADRVRALGLWLAVVSGGTLLLAHLFNHVALDDRIGELQASAEQNVWSWAASMATFAAGLSALLLAQVTQRPLRVFVLGGVLLFFALDDYVEIHENLGEDVSGALGFPDYVGPRLWTLIYLPLVALVAALLWSLASELDRRARGLVLAGAGLLACGYVLEAVGIATKRLENRGVELPHAVRAGLEESAELAGWILLAAGMTAGLVARSATAEPETGSRHGSSLAR